VLGLREVPLAARPDLRSLSVRRLRVVSAQRQREGALVDDVPPPHTVVALELAEGPLFISYPVDVEPSDLRDGMTLELCWSDAIDRLGEYNLPSSARPPPEVEAVGAPTSRSERVVPLPRRSRRTESQRPCARDCAARASTRRTAGRGGTFTDAEKAKRVKYAVRGSIASSDGVLLPH
jgi:hypothetical protein